MNMGDRIKKVRISLDMTQTEFAKRIGSMQNTITRYETNNRNPSASVIALICREFNVNEDWLRTGIGDMFKASPRSVLDALSEEYRLSAASYVMVEKFVKLKPETQEAIFNYIREVAAAFQSEETQPESPAPAAADLSGLTIDEKVARYRQELEREEKVGEKSEASQHGA